MLRSAAICAAVQPWSSGPPDDRGSAGSAGPWRRSTGLVERSVHLRRGPRGRRRFSRSTGPDSVPERRAAPLVDHHVSGDGESQARADISSSSVLRLGACHALQQGLLDDVLGAGAITVSPAGVTPYATALLGVEGCILSVSVTVISHPRPRLPWYDRRIGGPFARPRSVVSDYCRRRWSKSTMGGRFGFYAGIAYVPSAPVASASFVRLSTPVLRKIDRRWFSTLCTLTPRRRAMCLSRQLQRRRQFDLALAEGSSGANVGTTAGHSRGLLNVEPNNGASNPGQRAHPFR